MSEGVSITRGKGKSPYSKHGKKEYAYSEHYHRWARAVSEEDRQTADIAFRRAFGVPTFGSGRDGR